MRLLERIEGPGDLTDLTAEELHVLAAEIRDFLVQSVCRTGGHLGPNLGVVELTLALHRVFESPRDRLVWDTGHQAYVHKLLTGRRDLFTSLRQPGGLSGYPSRTESPHDLVENSHASTAISYADGLAKAAQLRGEDHAVVAVIGDGALTGGMAWEALNSLAEGGRPVVVVVNDNGRSYAPTIGGLQRHLAQLRVSNGYEHALALLSRMVEATPVVGQQLLGRLKGMKRGLRDVIAPQPLFEDLGLKYVGPIDGHDVVGVERALRQARDFHGPVIVHCLTRKGLGYQPAEDDEADCLHGVGVIDPASGRATSPSSRSWTNVFGEEIVAIGAQRPDVVAITAAMLQPVGLGAFAEAYPDRVFDVGIAEQHAVTSAAGLATGGLHPVVCLYATFLNRAFDQVLMDVALHRLPVTFVLDRAGVTGPDGPSHHGMWDLALMGIVPGMALAAPRDEPTLRRALREAVATPSPTVVRYPKGTVAEAVPAVREQGGMDVLRDAPADHDASVVVVGVGPMATQALAVADRAADQGIGVTVVDPRWVLPVPEALVDLACSAKLVVTLEDGVRGAGVGARLLGLLAQRGASVPVHVYGLADAYLDQGSRGALLTGQGLDPRAIARRVVETVAASEQEPARSALDS